MSECGEAQQHTEIITVHYFHKRVFTINFEIKIATSHNILRILVQLFLLEVVDYDYWNCQIPQSIGLS